MQIGIRQSLYFFMIDLIEIKKPLALCSGFFGIWCPYGDSNPGYRRERGLAHFHFIFVNFCSLALIVAARLNIRANFRVLNVRNAGLFSHLNVLKVVKHDKAGCLVLSKN